MSNLSEFYTGGMPKASQTQAETGAADDVLMTPLGVASYVKRGQANGVASLDASGKIPSGQMNLTGYAEMYTGNSVNETDYPIGSVLNVEGPAGRERNVSATVRLATGTYGTARFLVNDSSSAVALSGTWRSRGMVNNIYYIFQRVA